LTIVAGYHCPTTGQVWIGSDTRGCSSDGFILPVRVPKIVAAGKWLIGCAGTALAAQIIERDNRMFGDCETPQEVANTLMDLLQMGGFKRDEDAEAPAYGQTFVLASPDGVWGVAGDGYVAQPDDGFIACGSGQAYAYGAWTVMRDLLETGYEYLSPEIVVRCGVKAALRFDAFCGGDIDLRTPQGMVAAPAPEPEPEPLVTAAEKRWLNPEDEAELHRRGLA